MKLAVDVAADFSDPAGARNMAKVWWHRGSSQVTDLPTELRFERDRWGTGELRAAGETPIVIDRGNLFVVPVSGKVTVDGDLGDWDLSCAYGPQSVDPQLKEKNNVTWVMMYDAQALYMGAIFKSEYPLGNQGGVDNVWWKGDSLEFRLSADTKVQTGDPKKNEDILSFGMWYNDTENEDYLTVCRSFTDRNENSQVDEGEQVRVGPVDAAPVGGLAYWSSSIDERDLSLYLSAPGGPNPRVIVVQPTFLRPGVLVYDFTKTRVILLAAAKKNAKSELASIWHTPDGGVFGNAAAPGSDPRGLDHSSYLSDVYVYRLDRDHKLLWRAGKKASGLAKEGEFYGRACGLGGPITDKYFEFPDEGGQDLVYTSDGLYVYQNQVNKRWYMTAGGDGYANLWEIVGLDTIKRMTAQITVP